MTFVPACEICGTKGATRCPRHQRRSTPRQIRRHTPARAQVCCEECGATSGLRKHYKLDPRNWHEQRRLLCLPCGRTSRYTPVDHARVAIDGTWLSGKVAA